AAYAWTSGAGGLGAVSVTATSGANLIASDSVSVEPDPTGPSGVSIALSGGPYYSALSVPLTLSSGTDSQAGLNPASATVERRVASLASGSCGAFGAWSAVTLSGGADTGVASGNCY